MGLIFDPIRTENGRYVMDLGISILVPSRVRDKAIAACKRDFQRFYPQIATWMKAHRVSLVHQQFVPQVLGLGVAAHKRCILVRFTEMWRSLVENTVVFFRRREVGTMFTAINFDARDWLVSLPDRARMLCPHMYALPHRSDKITALDHVLIKDRLRHWSREVFLQGPIICLGPVVYFYSLNDLVLARLAGVLNKDV